MTKFLIIQAKYYNNIADMLLSGAVEELKKNDIEYEVISVPGCFELPAALAMALEGGDYDAYIMLGCLVRGETSHFDHISQETTRGINHLATEFSLAIGFGVLTTENMEQAIVRADPKQKNKGKEAASAAIEMNNIKNHFFQMMMEDEDDFEDDDTEYKLN